MSMVTLSTPLQGDVVFNDRFPEDCIVRILNFSKEISLSEVCKGWYNACQRSHVWVLGNPLVSQFMPAINSLININWTHVLHQTHLAVLNSADAPHIRFLLPNPQALSITAITATAKIVEDANLVAFFTSLNRQIPENDRLSLEENSPVDQKADAIRVWMGEHQEKLDRIEKLNLSSSGLTTLPKEACQLVGLKKLDLSCNSLTFLPKQIGQLKNLQKLDLSGNELASLPKETYELKDLEELDLHKNQLETFPPEIGCLAKLTQLRATKNPLTSLPKEMGQLKELQRFDFSHKCLNVDELPPEINRFLHQD